MSYSTSLDSETSRCSIFCKVTNVRSLLPQRLGGSLQSMRKWSTVTRYSNRSK